jgi:Phosphatidylinositol transfer protein
MGLRIVYLCTDTIFVLLCIPFRASRLCACQSWAAYPNRCLTLYYWPYLSARSVMSIESRYLADCGETKNALELSDDELDARRVVTLDIASEEQLGMSADADVSKFQSSRANRGALQAGVWMRNADPVMCCYKVCRVDVSQSKIEQWGQRLIQSSFIHYNRQALVWMDSWLGLSHDDVSGVSGTGLPAACAPFPPEKTRTMVATEIATEALGLASLTAFAHADASDPFS